MRLIQEDYVGDPWRVLVASLLLKRTTGKQVRAVLDNFFEKFPVPTREISRGDKLKEIEDIIQPLGLWRKRAVEICNISQHLYIVGKPTTIEEVLSINGVGTYVANAYAIFVLGDHSVNPSDEKLRNFLNRNKGGE